ncbi:GTP-binding protein gtr2 [Dispira simplex]|nr:GTP-binding protein gtr2 [Dispira simplex]
MNPLVPSSTLPSTEDIQNMVSNHVPRLLLLGLKRSGKTSILDIVFRQGNPEQTLHFDGSLRVERFQLESICNITFVDVPGSLDLTDLSDEDAELIFGGNVSIVFVIDAMTSDRLKSMSVMKLCTVAKRAFAINPNVNLEVLIHKLDSQTIQFKTQIQRMFERHIQEEAYDMRLYNAMFSYHVTSIFNCSIQIALSKIIQKLVPQVDTFESLLSSFVEKSDSHQVYLMDLGSRLFFAKDSGPLDPDIYELTINFFDLMEGLVEQQHRQLRNDPDAAVATAVVELDDNLYISYAAVNTRVGIMNVFRNTPMNRSSVIEYNLRSLRRSLQEALTYQEQQQLVQLHRFRQRYPHLSLSLAAES